MSDGSNSNETDPTENTLGLMEFSAEVLEFMLAIVRARKEKLGTESKVTDEITAN